MGSHFQGYRKSSGFFGIVPEVLEGSGGYHSGAHLSRTTNMDRRGRIGPHGPCTPAPPRPMWLYQVDKIKSLENRDLTWGGSSPPCFGRPKGLEEGPRQPPHAYIRGRGGLGRSTSSPQALAAPLSLLLLPAQAWRSPAGISPPPPPPRRRAAGIPRGSTTPPLPAGTGRGWASSTPYARPSTEVLPDCSTGDDRLHQQRDLIS
jgi:hypothetical protein